MAHEIVSDTPVVHPDNDRLGYATFSKYLADALIANTSDEGLVIALTGSWGSGKTTCINFVRYYLNQEQVRPIILHFNPWWFSGENDLIYHFFQELFMMIETHKLPETLSNNIAEYGGTFSRTGVGRIEGKSPPSFRQDKSVSKMKEDICNELKSLNQQLLFIIDDIDRLSGEEIVDIFRLVKAVGDFPNTNYLLVFDREVVVNALQKVQGVSGEEYLEKIVQVVLDLPEPDKMSIRGLFSELIDNILEGTNEKLMDRTYFGNVYWDGVDHFLGNLRHVKRLTNSLRVTYPAVRGEVNPADFIAMETLRVFCPNVYQLIRANPEMFVRQVSDGVYGGKWKDEVKEFHEKWIAEVSDRDRETIKRLISRIFPKFKTAVIDNVGYSHGFEVHWRKNLRACSPETFPVFFKFSIPQGDISNSEMNSLIALAPDSKTFSERLLELAKQYRPDGKTKVSILLERMQDYTEKEIPTAHIRSILGSLFDVGDRLLDSRDEGHGFLGFGNDLRIARLFSQLIERYTDQDERFDVVKKVFESGRADFLIVKQVSFLQEDDESESTEEGRVFTLEQLKELKKIALHKIKDSARNGRLLSNSKYASLLFRWRELENENAPKEWLEQSGELHTDEGLVDFLTLFLTKGQSMTLGDRVPSDYWRLDPKNIGWLVDVDCVAKRSSGLINHPPVWLQGKRRIAVETFLKYYKNPES